MPGAVVDMQNAANVLRTHPSTRSPTVIPASARRPRGRPPLRNGAGAAATDGTAPQRRAALPAGGLPTGGSRVRSRATRKHGRCPGDAARRIPRPCAKLDGDTVKHKRMARAPPRAQLARPCFIIDAIGGSECRFIILRQKQGDTSDERWEASSLKEGCWTEADTEDLARRQVGQASFVATSAQLDGLGYSPWIQKRLVDCRVDEGRKDVPSRQILSIIGEIIDMPAVPITPLKCAGDPPSEARRGCAEPYRTKSPAIRPGFLNARPRRQRVPWPVVLLPDCLPAFPPVTPACPLVGAPPFDGADVARCP